MPLAVIVGVALGFLTGGRVQFIGQRAFSAWGLLVLGAVLQVAAQAGAGGERSYLLVAGSFALLAMFAAANLRFIGMGVVLGGLLLNVATIAVNQGMPVEERAIIAAGIAKSPAEVATLDFKAKRHLMTKDDTLYWLSDILPARVLGVGQVLSIGDLVMSMGVADVLANLLHPFPRRRRPKSQQGRDTTKTSPSEPEPFVDLRDTAGDRREIHA